MKYLRTKDGRIIKPYKYADYKHAYYYFDKDNVWNFCENGDVLKQADTIEELCDEYVLREKANCKLDVDYGELTEDDVKLCLQDHDIFGAIWVNGDKEEPILKSVAKMNEKGDLELL